MDKAIDLLKKHWGFNSFREPQEAIIKELLDKNDAFVLLPTGAGKSLCYQMPALLADGVCLVISPLTTMASPPMAFPPKWARLSARMPSRMSVPASLGVDALFRPP